MKSKQYKCLADTKAYQRTCHTDWVTIKQGEIVDYRYSTVHHAILAYPNYKGYPAKTNVDIKEWQTNFEEA